MFASMYRVCADVLLEARGFPNGYAGCDADAVRQRLAALLDRMVSEGRRLGLPNEELAEARYALVAFIDEQVLRSEWPGRGDWMRQPLQLRYYRENAAGENFFRRLAAALQAPRVRPSLEAYALCLALGFRGAFGESADPRALLTYRRAAYRRLQPELGAGALFGQRSAALPVARRRRRGKPVAFALVAALVLSAGTIGVCAWSVRDALRRTLSEIGCLSAAERSS